MIEFSMGIILERAKQIFNRGRRELAQHMGSESESGWIGDESYKYKEYFSNDGSRMIVVTIFGGPEYGNTFIKDIRLYAIGENFNNELMRVQAVADPDEDEIRYNVYLESISSKGGWMFTHVDYLWRNEGRMSEPHLWSDVIKHGKFAGMPDDEYREYCRNWSREQGLYNLEDLPTEIDLEATVTAFREQIEEHNFSMPRLVLKPEKLPS